MNVPPSLVAALVLATVWFCVVPVLVLVHELGHAAAALALTDDSATVVVGGERWRRERGRLTLLFDLDGWRRWWYGFCRYETRPDRRWSEVAVHLAGPAATVGALLGVTATINLVAGRWPRFALYSVFWWGTFQLVMTLAPIRYPSWWGPYADRPSDGLQARRAFANE